MLALPTGQPWSSLTGCSSELAVFYENGPFEIADNMSLTWNEYDWDKEIFAAHPEYATCDIFLTGESYDGHYVLVFTARVHKGNKAKEGIHINLKGFSIVNGFTDFRIHYKAYADYALDMRIIEQPDYDSINKVLVLAYELTIKLCGTDGKISCTTSYFVCNTIFIPIMSHARHINYYDIRKKCGGILCYDFSNKEKFLNQGSVRDALGVGDIDFVSCSSIVFQAMLVDWLRNLDVGIPALLPFLKAVCQSKKSWLARHTNIDHSDTMQTYVFIILIFSGIILLPVLLLVALTDGGGKNKQLGKQLSMNLASYQ
ncbi:serine carboxypeptidase-like 49 [Vicia villosa]|uniref:serine carboxypeptidase-like 49 n=1 Tax=Vicia villosa TaxID=3911 RepID=UPI00273AC50B|nr:serine carboxypeptidase-like 49 [Vicia villosa]